MLIGQSIVESPVPHRQKRHDTDRVESRMHKNRHPEIFRDCIRISQAQREEKQRRHHPQRAVRSAKATETNPMAIACASRMKWLPGSINFSIAFAGISPKEKFFRQRCQQNRSDDDHPANHHPWLVAENCVSRSCSSGCEKWMAFQNFSMRKTTPNISGRIMTAASGPCRQAIPTEFAKVSPSRANGSLRQSRLNTISVTSPTAGAIVLRATSSCGCIALG